MKTFRSLAFLGLSSALLGLAGCSAPPAPAQGPAPSAPQGQAPPQAQASARAVPADTPPSPYAHPAPVKGHYEEANLGSIDLVDGLAYTASGGGTVVYVASKPIASPIFADSTCPMTRARSLALLRNAGFLEVKLDGAGRSDYFAGGTQFDGRSRESEMGSHYWTISGGKVASGRVAGRVAYKGRGQFDFDLPVLASATVELSEGDRATGKQEEGRRAATGAEVLAAYTALQRAALARDWKALLAAQGFEAKEIEAIRGLAGIDADLAAHADRFLSPGTPGEPSLGKGRSSVGARGKNSKDKAFFNYYAFTTCGDKLVLVSIAQNPL